jgi:DNA (cytosine-5)-methyltransferase 1
MAVLQPLCYDMDNERRRGQDEFVNISPALTARAGTGGGNVPAVIPKTYQRVTGPLMANSHPGSYTGQDAFSDMLVAGVDARNATEYPEITGALQADAAHNLNSNNVVRIQYIVRRLTPTECARLQGFPDAWGHPDKKTEFTDEEYQFWLNVRNTHAAINDKPTKDYTKDQILKWYNSLHTDSSEYKMWGNGIALPNALYVMQGIADVMTEEKAARRKWLDELLGGCL